MTEDLFEFGTLADAKDVIDDWYAAHPELESGGAAATDGPVLMTDTMSWALKMNLPIGLVILLYLMGSETEETVPDDPEDLPEHMELNEDGETVTIHTNHGDITAALGETVHFSTRGFSSVLSDMSNTILEKFEENKEAIDETIEEYESAPDADDPEYNVFIKEKDQILTELKNANDTLINSLDVVNDIHKSLIDMASAWLDKDFQQWKAEIQRW